MLDCLSGYLLLGQRFAGGRRVLRAGWNFGPAADDNRSVGAVLERMRAFWPELGWVDADTAGPHEAALLGLDSAEARSCWAGRRCGDWTMHCAPPPSGTARRCRAAPD